LRRLIAMDRFPVKREEDAATYKNPRGRVFAWQATFDLVLWKRVVRALGRDEIEIHLEEEPRARKRRAAALPAPAPPPTASAAKPRAGTASRNSPPVTAPEPAPPRTRAAAPSPMAATRPAAGSAGRTPRSPDL